MPWALVAVLIQFLATLNWDWLRELLKSLPEQSLSTNEAVAIGQVFAAARQKMGWLDVLRLRGLVLNRIERACLTNAPAIGKAALGVGNAPKLSQADRELFGI